MAVFPQGLSQVDARCNSGERRVLHQLKRCLEDDYIVWHDVPLGPKARQPDFVVLSPRWGVLLLEVKDWRRATLGRATRDAVELQTPRGRVTQAHPLRQARDYAMELVALMQQDPALVHANGPFAGRLLFPYGWGVVMAGLRRAELALAEDFDTLFPPSRTLLRDDLEDGIDPAAFQHRLWGMFHVSYPHTLSLPQRDRIRWHLFPEVRLGQQAALDFDGAPVPAPTLPDLMQVMDLQQEQVARTLGEGHRVIHGSAGSGKTMILIYRAQFLAGSARPDRPILVLCFNRSLADRIDALLRQRGVDERVQVRTFHSWCQDLVRSYQLDTPPRAALRGDAYFEALARAVERAVDSGRVPGGQYHALLIDEAHDFEDAWLRIAARMVDPATRSLLVLYDDAQSIYRLQQARQRKFNFSSVGIEARGRTSVLRLNYRNTAEVLALAMACTQGLVGAGVGAGAAAAAAAGSRGGDTRGGEGAGSVGTAVHPAADTALDSSVDSAVGNGVDTAVDEDQLTRVAPTTAGRRGPLPVLLEARHAGEEAEWLAERLARAHGDGLALNEMAVLCRTRQQMAPIEAALRRRGLAVQSMQDPAFRRFDWRRPSIKLVTLHSTKGLEFALVCVAGLQAMPLRDEGLAEAARLLYVGMTRATVQLVLSAQVAPGRDSPLLAQVRQGLAAVSRQFAAEAESAPHGPFR